MKSLLTLRVERDRAVNGSSGRHTYHQGRHPHELRLSNEARNREIRGACAYSSLVVIYLDTRVRRAARVDKNRMLSHSRSVIVHYERIPIQKLSPRRPREIAGRSGYKLDAVE